MGPINWPAVIVSAIVAVAIGFAWYGPLFGRGGERRGKGGSGSGLPGGIGGALLLQAFSALMLAHNFARLGAATLAAKPWLYWMQSGGIALAFIIPALWISYARQRLSRREALIDAGFWLLIYLATGTIFWALR